MGFDFPCEFSYPVIVKPSNSIAYWEHPFETQNKVYKLGSREEMEKVLHQIYDAGYDDAVIIQDMVPGNDDTSSASATFFCSRLLVMTS